MAANDKGAVKAPFYRFQSIAVDPPVSMMSKIKIRALSSAG